MVTGNKVLNITLLAIVISLTVVVLIRPELLPSRRMEKLIDINTNAINSVTINNADQIVKLSKLADKWFVNIGNRKIPANKRLISTILKFPQQQALTINSSSNEDTVKYGLTDSRLSVTYNDTIIEIGNSEPLANRHYATNSNKIFVINDLRYRYLKSPLTKFIDTSLIRPEQIVTNLKILWKQRPPIQLPTTKSKQLFKNWQRVKAEKIQLYEGEEAIAIVLIQINFQTILEFNVIPSKNTLRLARKDLGIVYVIPRQYMPGLLTFTPPRYD